MKLHEALEGTRLLFLDTAPVIHHVQGNPDFQKFTDIMFQRLQNGTSHAVTSPSTLAECLVLPYRLGNRVLAERFRN